MGGLRLVGMVGGGEDMEEREERCLCGWDLKF